MDESQTNKCENESKKYIVHKPLLHIECSLKEKSTCRFDTAAHHVRQFLLENFSSLTLNTEFRNFEDELLLMKHVEQIRVVEASGSDKEILYLDEVDLDIHIYQLNNDLPTLSSFDYEDQEDGPMAIVTELPSLSLEGLWDNLVFENNIKNNLLHFIHTVMLFSDKDVNFNIVTWNRALAQKLSIRLSNKFSRGRVLRLLNWQNVPTNSRNDEVESLTAARKAAASGLEPSDGLRVVNSLLTQLDKLKPHKNVFILTTSNLVEAMDPAFVDRIDIKQYVGDPNPDAIFAILQSCINELGRKGLIEDGIPVPSFTEASISLYSQPNSHSSRLYRIAVDCKGLSGRTLRRLPVLAHAKYLQRPCFEERGESARMSTFVGAIAVGDLDKILQSASTGEIVVTNDGATILRSISLDNAAAKALVNVSITQDNEIGDGTTSVTVLAAELLREAERLIDSKIHPQTIIDGYRIATSIALNALYESSVDHKDNSELFRKDLENIARTTLSSKILAQDRDHFSKLAVDAVFRSTNLESIQIIKKLGGKLKDSYLDEGFILEKKIGVNQPKRLENVKILVANTPMDTDKVKIFGARVKVNTTSKLAELEKAEKAKVEKIKAHGINCFVNRQLIYNWPEQLFADAGIISIEHADFDGIERLALVTGGEIASTFDHPEYVKLGKCDLIEEIIIGEDKMIKFSGVAAGEACATSQLLDEAERSLHDALSVLLQTMNDSKTILGGGCSEILMAKAVDSVASKESGKKVHAIEAFARALRTIPMILASNAGLDSSELVSLLRSAHYNGMISYGLDLINGEIADMRDAGVIESYKLKYSIVSSASEVAEMLLS
ncbi:hypothetical protein PMAC_001143 [Pneumocystis sp. 'macacae']|nr:hypothetical protein PMAC_001143 [Pneumocystis sp. 'macacae']